MRIKTANLSAGQIVRLSPRGKTWTVSSANNEGITLHSITPRNQRVLFYAAPSYWRYNRRERDRAPAYVYWFSHDQTSSLTSYGLANCELRARFTRSTTARAYYERQLNRIFSPPVVQLALRGLDVPRVPESLTQTVIVDNYARWLRRYRLPAYVQD